jgi:anthranilate 1,2-dioxygenase ferredoxin component
MNDEVFTPALLLEEFPPAGIAMIEKNGWRVLIARVDGGYHALNDRCPHAASPLSTGRLRHGVIMCPLHGARFELASGKCLGNAYRAVRSFPVRVVGGWIEVAIPAQPPSPSEMPVIS